MAEPEFLFLFPIFIFYRFVVFANELGVFLFGGWIFLTEGNMSAKRNF